MCVSASPAHFKGTSIMLNLTQHPQYGEIFVLGYQNTARNLGTGPNAMLLHLPAKDIQERNFIDASRYPGFFKDLQRAVTPMSRGATLSASFGAAKGITVFDHDIYTVVLADDARSIPLALDQVPQNKRPAISQELCEFYHKQFPDWPIALCCFDNKAAAAASPLLIWYSPMDSEVFHCPAIDSHTGGVPDLFSKVLVDHTVYLGSDTMEHGTPVMYASDVGKLKPFLPKQVLGLTYRGMEMNSDFRYPRASIEGKREYEIQGLAPRGEHAVA